MSITIRLTPTAHHVEFEVGSPEEGIGFVTDKSDALMRLLDVLDRLPKGEGQEAEAAPAASEAPKERKPRGPNKPKVEAVAPAPLAVPSAAPSPPAQQQVAAPAAPPAPVDTTTVGDNGIPAFLDRTGAPAAPPPPPPAPPAPLAPSVPAAPPPGIVASKVADNLQQRLAGTKATDNGAGLLQWLMLPDIAGGLVIKGATVEEVIAMLRMQTDDKVRHMLVPLDIAA